MKGLTTVVAILFAGGALWAQDDPAKAAEKEAEAKAKKKIADLNAALKKCKTEDDFVSALDGFAEEQQHPLIMAELKKYLGHGLPGVRMEAADELGKFKKDEKAAKALLDSAKRDRVVDCARQCLKEVGDIGFRGVARDLVGFFAHKELDLCKEAVESSGALKSKDSIDPLIALVTELEVEKEKQNNSGGQQNPGGGGNPGGVGGGLPGGGGGGQQSADDEKKKRADELLPKAIQALKDITGEKFNTSKEWKKWWQKNKQFFKELEDK